MKTNKQCKYFKLAELLAPEYFEDQIASWILIDDRLKVNLDWLREKLGVPLTINNYSYTKSKNPKYIRRYSGLRPMNCKIGAKNSRHKYGLAADIISNAITASSMRKFLKDHASEIPYPIRVEQGVNWLHMDVDNPSKKIIYFKA